MRSRGSRTGLYGFERCTPSRARRARTRLEELLGRPDGAAAERNTGVLAERAEEAGLGRGCSAVLPSGADWACSARPLVAFLAGVAAGAEAGSDWAAVSG